jgi:DNA polymerase III subunit epsilon
MYAIVDIETTGGRAGSDRITEIAIVFHNGTEITGQFSSLINPERSIPYNITMLTGITNEMVERAPCFYEVAKTIVEKTEGLIFVAHNVSFDYRFVQAEFKQLGFKYDRPTLCTVKLSRKLIPGYKSYSLGEICRNLGIDNNARHRALGDAMATGLLMNHIVAANGGPIYPPSAKGLRSSVIHPSLDLKVIDDLPEACGVYYLYNETGNLIYIGKSKNIKERILQHLANYETSKSQHMASEIASVDYVITGSELVALLLESDEIKIHAPRFNRAQRRTNMPYGLYANENENGYITLKVKKTALGDLPLTVFKSHEEGVKIIEKLCRKHKLCESLCDLYSGNGSCFAHQLGDCGGACVGREFAFSYNMRVEALCEGLKYKTPGMAIFEQGKHADETAIVWIENGMYCGFGFFDNSDAFANIHELRGVVQPKKDNRDVQQIINQYLKTHPNTKIVKLNSSK